MVTNDEPFLVRTHGVIDRQPFHSTPGTKQDDVMLTVFLSGRGTYRNAAGETEIGAGMVGIVPADDPGVLMADPQDPYLHYYCRFTGAYAISVAHEIVETRGARFFTVPDAHEIAACIRRMGPPRSGGLARRVGMRDILLAEALIRLRTVEIEAASALTPDRIESYLADHLSHPTDLAEIATHFGVSVATLCRFARTRCGRTVQKLHEDAKIEWAERLLASTRLSIAEIAFRVGYTDPLYFSRVFTRRVGQSPRSRRNELSVASRR